MFWFGLYGIRLCRSLERKLQFVMISGIGEIEVFTVL